MHPVFSFHRFSLLVGRHWAENRKKYLLSLGAYAGLLSLWCLFLATTRRIPVDPELQQVTYFFCLFLGGALYASQHFGELATKPRAISYLMTPASLPEKLLCSLFYALPLFFVAFTATFYLVDTAYVTLVGTLHPYYSGKLTAGNIPRAAEVANVWVAPNRHGNQPNFFIYFYLAFIAVQSAFLLGSVYFPRYSFIKTVIALFLTALVVGLLVNWFTERLLPGGFTDNFSTYLIFKYDKATEVQLPKWIGEVFASLLKYAIAPVFWITTYYRLREKEV
ncbi:hypothetical protein V9K67_06105 [Paraflavisolibacter sp. H34]|uniref:hypothetical protein n=1 Tax=Huijunlia imazamoxiresistens TaxID=3127457 RepID=UPI003019B1B1